jgi:hypothetical protein
VGVRCRAHKCRGGVDGNGARPHPSVLFFRLKETRSGQVLKLVESYRDEAGRSRHRAVASLGNAPLARKDWKPVAKAIEDRLYGRKVLLARDLNAEHAAWVDRIVRQVGSEGRWQPQPEAADGEEYLDGVRAAAVSHTDTA